MPWTKLVADKNQQCLAEESCSSEDQRILTYGDAITEAIDQAMQLDRNVTVLGEGVDTAGYIYNTTCGLSEKYGKERVIETPIAEAAVTGITLGMAIAGLRPILMHMRNDFLLVSMDQIVNHIAHWQRMFPSRTGIPLVIRAIVARGWGSGPQHSQSFQALFAGLDGIDVVMPATPYDVKGLFLGAVASPRPTLFLEHRWLYGSKGHVPQEPYTIPIGVAAIRAEGSDCTVVAMSQANNDVGKVLAGLAAEGISADWIDLRSIHPWDFDAVSKSVMKTGRLLIVENGPVRCGVGAEMAAYIAEKCWQALKAPIHRVGWPGSTVPAGSKLEEKYYPGADDVARAIRKLVEA